MPNHPAARANPRTLTRTLTRTLALALAISLALSPSHPLTLTLSPTHTLAPPLHCPPPAGQVREQERPLRP